MIVDRLIQRVSAVVDLHDVKFRTFGITEEIPLPVFENTLAVNNSDHVHAHPSPDAQGVPDQVVQLVRVEAVDRVRNNLIQEVVLFEGLVLRLFALN